MVRPDYGGIAAAVASAKPAQMLRPVLALSWLLLGGLVSAHPGGLDKTGGHTDKKTGQYHRHATTGPRTATPAESPARAEANIVTGRVVGVTDGDTITLLNEAKVTLKIRLHAIDAPEAKNAGRGLWADKTPVPPWEHRKNDATARVPVRP